VQQALSERTISNPFRYTVLDVPFPPPHEDGCAMKRKWARWTGEPTTRGITANNCLWTLKQAIDRMIVPPGFRVELFAAEPDIVNPISMNWDEQGRLWVIESIEYPYPRDFWPDGGGKDRILVLEDTNGDGRADEFTVFAENLNIPTSLTFADGGVIVNRLPRPCF
jgi:glucose/arabinose dehydrogenase